MNERVSRSWFKHLDFILLDILSCLIAFFIAFRLRMPANWTTMPAYYRSYILVVLGFYILIVFFFRGHSDIVRRGSFAELGAVLFNNLLIMVCMTTWLVFTKQAESFSRLFQAYFYIINTVLSYVVHILWKLVIRKRLSKDENVSQLLVVTTKGMVEQCIKDLTTKEYPGYTLQGIVLLDGRGDREEYSGIPVVADREDMMEYVRLNIVDQVLIQPEHISDSLKKMADRFLDMGIVVHIGLGYRLGLLPNKHMETLGEQMVLTSSIRSANSAQLALKRLLDICGAFVGLMITGVAAIIVGPIIYLKSPGPIFFSQTRVGKNGRKFQIYKFRSMYMDAEERKKELMAQNKIHGLMFKVENDPRIIKGIGHFIRDTSIDELPQFWNVLRGDMSLVGTRPPTMDEFEQYELHHKVRLAFRPGLTGMWQVSGRSEITDFEEVVRLDESYIANWNIFLDIKILLKTVLVVLQRKGSS